MPLEDLYPLSALQQGLLFETLADPEGVRYVQQIRWHAEGPLDTRRYRAAWQRIVDRHPVLRSCVVSGDDGQPLTAVLSSAELPVSELDWRDVPAAEQAGRLEQYCRHDRIRGFDLDSAPLSRLSLIRLGATSWESVWTFHHLLLDGWSIGRLIRELGPLYADPGTELPAPPPYRDYIGWLADRDDAAARSHWKTYLEGFTAPVELGLPSGDPSGELVAERTLVLDQRMEDRLRETARRLRVTPSVVAQAAWAVVLSRYTHRDEVVFGTTVSGRPPALPRVEEMVGLFINTLPVRVRLRPGLTTAGLLHTLHTEQLDREPYEHTPLYEIQSHAELAPGTPLFGTLCIYENYPVSAPFPDQRIIPDVDLVQGRNTEVTSYALALSLVPQERLRVFASFDPRKYDPAAVEQLLGHYARVLDAMVEGPDRPVDELPLLGAEEVAVLRKQACGPELEVPARTVHAWVEETAAADPYRIAVVADGGGTLTYGELVRRADGLARVLVAHGVGVGDLVGVHLSRGPELVVSVLAVLKAGAAFVPLEPDLPRARLEFMVRDARPAAVIGRFVDGGLADIEIDRPLPDPGAVRLPDTGPDSLAYCLYTSGSTGRPKGVLIEHRGLVNRLASGQESYRLSPGDRVLHKAPPGFDVSVRELFWPLITGARLVLATPDGHRDPAYLACAVEAQQITVIHFVPSMLAELVRVADARQLRSLRLVLCGGEVLTAPVARRMTELCGAELHNLYGPTETSIDVAAHQVRAPVAEALVPIGRPTHNTELYVLDRQRNPVPPGALGELYVGGVQLARGYHRRPELTVQRFCPHPYAPGQRIYRTGDLARLRDDGTLELHGRIDHQVKLNGMRVELGEIENALREVPGIGHAVASVRDGRLHAHLVAAADSTRLTATELRSALADTLPGHMIPSVWHWLDELPTLPSGKADRARILSAAGTAAERSTPYTAPRGPTEELICRVWRETLGVERVGVHDDFRELGGGSLDLVKVAFRLREELDQTVELRELLRHSTVAVLAAALDGGEARGGRAAPLWSPAREKLALPAMPATRTAPGKDNPGEGDTLLTGATGYLGAFLLPELLARTTGHVHCLVRAGTEAEARRRVVENLQRYGLSVEAERLRMVPGDLGRPSLGLSAERFEQLGAALGRIVHAGAQVDMLASYNQLAPVNIGGALELLRLAAAGRLTPLHYLSTGHPRNELMRFHVDYGLTKWRAERLVADAGEEGVPVSVFRLPRLTGDRHNGAWNSRDLAFRLLHLVMQTGAAPPLGTEEWVPVDEAASLIAETALRNPAGGMFTMAPERPTSLDELVELARREGYAVTAVSHASWEDILAERFPLEYELLQALAEERPAENSPQSVDEWGVLPDHAFTPLTAHGVDPDLLRRYARHLTSLPTPAR